MEKMGVSKAEVPLLLLMIIADKFVMSYAVVCCCGTLNKTRGEEGR